jgi:uncharacterized protein
MDPLAASRRAQPVRWGLRDAVLGLLLAQLAAAVGGLSILLALGYTEPGDVDTAPIALLFALQIPLWAAYFGWTWWTSRTRGHGLVQDFGLDLRWKDALYGVLIGIGTQIIIVPLLYVPILQLFPDQDVSEVARDLTDRAAGPLDMLVLLVILVVGAPIVEELFFRGLLLRSIERRWGTGLAIVGSSVVFGAIHFQLLQFPALVVFGAIAAFLTTKTGRLGPAIWAHVGFNGLTAIALLATS